MGKRNEYCSKSMTFYIAVLALHFSLQLKLHVETQIHISSLGERYMKITASWHLTTINLNIESYSRATIVVIIFHADKEKKVLEYRAYFRRLRNDGLKYLKSYSQSLVEVTCNDRT